ncbi:hypothetical protein ANCDUO_16562, partial [Ancylostoma duodenale]
STGLLLVPTVSVASVDAADRSREIREAIQQVSRYTTEDDVAGKNMFNWLLIIVWRDLIMYLWMLSGPPFLNLHRSVQERLCGTLTIFCYLCKGFISLSIYAGLFGFTISAYVCLTSVLLVDLLGLGKLTNAFGLLLLWQGVGTIFGPPIAGILADVTDTYVWSFVFCGINLLRILAIQ